MLVDRRSFCLTLTAAYPALTLLGCQRRRPAPAEQPCEVDRRTAGSGRVLNPAEWATLEAACARILPSDKDPGAAEADVVNFIDAQLALPHFSAFGRLFSAGLHKLDQLARAQGGAAFVALTPERQDRLLTRMEQGVRMGRRSSRQFFRLLVTFTLEGFLCDPVYGGNRGMAGWRFIGFEPRPPRPRCPYLG